MTSRRPMQWMWLAPVLGLASGPAWAVPSFARQTGLACAVCHTVYPELTPFGRLFKLNGYTLTGLQQIEASGSTGDNLKINAVPPLSAMIMLTATHLKQSEPNSAPPPANKQNNSVEFPQQLSFFFAGEISPQMGSFMQFTYTQADNHFHLDNTDIRYANHAQIAGADTIYGLTLNNNPTVEDVWNDTPAWGFPWAAADTAQTPGAATLLDGALAQKVAGLGGYALWDNDWYADVSFYRSSPEGSTQPLLPPGLIQGVAPYWRFAWSHQFSDSYLEIGTLGMQANVAGGLIGTGVATLDDKYTDMGVDSQYELPVGNDLFSLHAIYLHEREDLASSYGAGLVGTPNQVLATTRVNGTWHFGSRYATTLGLFRTTGTTDPVRWAPAALKGSANGSPNSRGWMAQVSYLPWENTQFALQYVGYNEFNGGTSNYDGSGRAASANNTLYLLAWLVW